MTLNRYLLLFTTLISTILAFLSFSPPQTGKWVYIWQADVMKQRVPEGYVLTESEYMDPRGYWRSFRLRIPEAYQGEWRDWNAQGKLTDIYRFQGNETITILGGFNGIDRRAEFGIPIE